MLSEGYENPSCSIPDYLIAKRSQSARKIQMRTVETRALQRAGHGEKIVPSAVAFAGVFDRTTANRNPSLSCFSLSLVTSRDSATASLLFVDLHCASVLSMWADINRSMVWLIGGGI
jgi:hypothetical protein